jgi:hypothetical protein
MTNWKHSGLVQSFPNIYSFLCEVYSVSDFKTTLEKVAKGELDIESFSRKLTKLLEQTPQHATRMLSQLDEMYAGKKINDQIYSRLKGHINQYRRAHASVTETTGGGGESTVFARDENAAPTGAAYEKNQGGLG